jgi:hypothetical protein
MNTDQNRNMPNFRVTAIESIIMPSTIKTVGNQLHRETFVLTRITEKLDITYLVTDFEVVSNSGLIEDYSNEDDAVTYADQETAKQDSICCQYPIQLTNNYKEICDLTVDESDTDGDDDSSIGSDFGDGSSTSSTVFSDKTALLYGPFPSKTTPSHSMFSTSIHGSSTTYISYERMNLSMKFSEQQIAAAEEIIRKYQSPSKSRWTILFAQMQSGKTGTFLLAGCEMLRRKMTDDPSRKMIDHVVVFSGNTEIDLKNQLVNKISNKNPDSHDPEFYIKYNNYLLSVGVSEEKARRIINSLKAEDSDKIKIVWGCELVPDPREEPPIDPIDNKYKSRTLHIWEESHHAQSSENRPRKYMTTVGICASGKINPNTGNYGLSVSATPFSELADYADPDQKQNKELVYLRPGEGYLSVEDIIRNKKLHTFTDAKKGLVEAFSSVKPTDRKYAIIRSYSTTSTKNIEKNLPEGWTCVTYDSENNNPNDPGTRAWNSMKYKPTQNTAIIIKQRCRMGKNVEKAHLAFVFEPSKDPNTDTALQGLLGRVCGYSQGSSDVHVWMSEELRNSNEFNRYIETIQCVSNPDDDTQTIKDKLAIALPLRGKNLLRRKPRAKGTKCHIRPIRFTNVQVNTNQFIDEREDQPQHAKATKAYKDPTFPRKAYSDKLAQLVRDLPDVSNETYLKFIREVYNKCNQEKTPDYIQYTVHVHDVCRNLAKAKTVNKSSTKDWTDLIPKLTTEGKFTDSADLNIPGDVAIEYLWDTTPTSEKLKRFGKSAAECEGYVVNLFVFTENPVQMFTKGTLNAHAKTEIEKYMLTKPLADFNIPPNTMFLHGVVDYPEGGNPRPQKATTNKKEAFCGKRIIFSAPAL